MNGRPLKLTSETEMDWIVARKKTAVLTALGTNLGPRRPLSGGVWAYIDTIRADTRFNELGCGYF